MQSVTAGAQRPRPARAASAPVYGSVECQAKHGSTHKASCKALAASVLARGPSSWERSRCSVEAGAAAAASAAGPRYGCAKKETTSMPQAAVCAAAAAAPADGSYACLICSKSVRGTDAPACRRALTSRLHRARAARPTVRRRSNRAKTYFAPRIHIGNSGQLPGGRDPPKWLRGSMRYIFTSLLSRLGLARSATSRLCAAVLVIFGDFCELIQ